jgi:hypothetical protein
MKFLAILLILFCGSNVVSAAERDAAITEDELVRRTQELYDAVVPGNQAPWKKYFADDCIFADEKGTHHGQDEACCGYHADASGIFWCDQNRTSAESDLR